MLAQGGSIIIKTYFNKEQIRIDIKDTGPGIANQDMNSVFKTFFTTKKKGLGIGLAVCQQIIKAHNGSLSLSNRKRNGLCASIIIPSMPLATAATQQLE